MPSTSTAPADPADGWSALDPLPPSAKLVAKVLEHHDGTMTQQEIAAESLLPDRTVRYALTRLEDVHLVESRFSFSDARKRRYSLSIE